MFEEQLQQSPNPDVIIITSIMTYWYIGVFDAIKILKRVFPNVPIILGGIYATLCLEHAKKFSGADHIVAGNGLIPVLKIIDTISNRKRDYDTIETHIDALPPPAYHLYSTLTSVSMLTSVGCPYRCSYCASRFIQPQFDERTPEAVMAEINYYHTRFNVSDIAFYDDALLVHAEKRFIPLAEKIIAARLPIRFHTPNGLNIRCITPTTAQLLYTINCKTIRLSFESAAVHIQRTSSMKTTNEELVNAHRFLKEAGYRSEDIDVYVMVGLLDQQRDDVVESVRFVHSLGLTVKLAQYSPIPHTKDFARLPHYETLAEEPLLHNNSMYAMTIDTCGMNDLREIKTLVTELNKKLKS